MKAIEISKEPVDSVQCQSNGKISKKESRDSIARRNLVVRKLSEIGMKGFHETTVSN